MGMIDIIKQASLGAVGADNPVILCFGEVQSIACTMKKEKKGEIIYNITESVDDLVIKLDQKRTLGKDFFIVPRDVTLYEAELKHKHDKICVNETCNKDTDEKLDTLIIRKGLKAGDKVLLLRVQGGQQYVVLGKVV